MTDIWEIPSTEDELKRKTLEAYEWIIERSGAGDMSESEIKVALQAIFYCTSGLVPKDITEAAEIVQGSAKAQAVQTRLFYNDDKKRTLFVRWTVGESKTDAGFLGSGTHKGGSTQKDWGTPRDAMAAFHQMCQNALSKGYEEI